MYHAKLMNIISVLIVITVIVFKAPCYKWLMHVLHYIEIYIHIYMYL